MRFDIPSNTSILFDVANAIDLSHGINVVTTLFAGEGNLTLTKATKLLRTINAQVDSGKNEELSEARFQCCMAEASMDGERNRNLLERLKGISYRLNNSHDKIKELGEKWLQSYFCKDKMQFKYSEDYLKEIENFFGKYIIKFLQKFANTRKRGFNVYDENCQKIHHDLVESSCVTNEIFAQQLFRVKDFGEKFQEVYDVYLEILNTICATKEYVVLVDMRAQLYAKDKQRCLVLLTEDIKTREELGCLTGIDIKSVPKELISVKNAIYDMPIEEVACKYYHQIPPELSNLFVALVQDAEKTKQNSPKRRRQKKNVKLSPEAINIIKHAQNFTFTDGHAMPVSTVMYCVSQQYNMGPSATAAAYNENCTGDNCHISIGAISKASAKILSEPSIMERFEAEAERLRNK